LTAVALWRCATGATRAAGGLTPFAVWNVCHRVPDRGAWATWRERMLAVLLVMLAFFCLYWRVAGTTLAF